MGRIVWIDTAKGIAISLVVFGHVLGGAMARGWLNQGGSPKFVYDFIYLFHMPLFFVLSGALAINAVYTNPKRAIIARLGSIAWPYVIWGVGAIALEPLIAYLIPGRQPTIGLLESFKGLLMGEASWFLWTLFVCHLILTLAVRTNIILLLVISIVLALCVNANLWTFNSVFHYMPFVVLGAIFSRSILHVHNVDGLRTCIIGFALFAILVVLQLTRMSELPGVYLVTGVVGSIACLAIAQSLKGSNRNHMFADIGFASLPVFLLHPYFQGLAREIVLRTIGSQPSAQLLIPTLIAILGPVIVWKLSHQFGLGWLFRLDLQSVHPGAAKDEKSAAG